MSNWKMQPLGELCELINGRAFKPSDWKTSGLPIIRIQNLNDENKPFNYYSGDYRDVHLIDNGEILLSWSGTPGTSFGCFRWNRGKAILNQHIFKVLPKEEIDGDFFINAVNSKLDEMISKAHGGVGLRHITKSKLEGIELPVPPIGEQRLIVARLKKCLACTEEIIRLRHDCHLIRANLLESITEAKFESVKGPMVALSEVCSIESPLVDPVDARYCNLLHVGGANIESSNGKLIGLKTAVEEKLRSAKFTFDSRMILYNKIRPYLKKVAKPDFSGLCSADMYPLLPDTRRLHRDYLFFLLLSRSFTRYAVDGSNRAGMPKVNRQHLFEFNFRLPTMDVQQRIALSLNAAFSTIGSLRIVMDENASNGSVLRDSVLRRAFAGEL